MAEAIIRDKKRILPCAAYCDREYGVGGYFVGVPCVLGTEGVEKVIEIELDAEERKMFQTSVDHVKELVAAVKLDAVDCAGSAGDLLTLVVMAMADLPLMGREHLQKDRAWLSLGHCNGLVSRRKLRSFPLHSAVIVLAALLAGCAAASANAPLRVADADRPQPPAISDRLTVQPYIRGLSAPTAMAWDDDGSLLVAEGGNYNEEPRISSFKKDGSL